MTNQMGKKNVHQGVIKEYKNFKSLKIDHWKYKIQQTWNWLSQGEIPLEMTIGINMPSDYNG